MPDDVAKFPRIKIISFKSGIVIFFHEIFRYFTIQIQLREKSSEELEYKYIFNLSDELVIRLL